MCSVSTCCLMAKAGGGPEFFVVALVVAVIVVPTVVIMHSKQSKKLDKLYALLARHYGGTWSPGGFRTRPTASFPHDGTDVLVDIYSTGGEHPTYYTQVHFFSLPAPLCQFRCELCPEGFLARLEKRFGVQDIDIGSPGFDIGSAGFDERYIIKSNDVQQVRELLSEPVRRQIDKLRGFLGNDDIYISVKAGSLLVKKLAIIRRYEQLRDYIQMATELYDQVASPMMMPGPDEIQFVEESAEPGSRRPVCQVCGEEITADEVLCRACKTPHHRDCWEYAAACSTYGCRETRCVAPKGRGARRSAGRR